MAEMNKYLIPSTALALIAIAALVVYATQNKTEVTTPLPISDEQVSSTQNSQTQTGEYKNGEYQAAGSYITPGGQRDVDVSITLEDNIITNATFEGHATDPASQRFQGEFADNYQSLVVGKNINDVELTKVSGSSLTPKGFMDALQNIKTQAQS